MAGFYYLYTQVAANHPANFASAFLGDNLFDAVITSWIFLAFYYSNGFLAAAFYGPQSRVMDGVLARANCLLITTLWTVFKFVMVPVGTRLATLYPPSQFATVFALIWGSYIVTDALAEIGGSLYGKQKLRVWGIGDVNRKSIGGAVSGFAGCLVFCLALVLGQGLPAPWIALAVLISVSNTLLELFSPRVTDDFTMATTNALICWAAAGMLQALDSRILPAEGGSTNRGVWLPPSGGRMPEASGHHHVFSRMFRYSTFIGGPTCTCTPSRPSAGRFGASSSVTTVMS